MHSIKFSLSDKKNKKKEKTSRTSNTVKKHNNFYSNVKTQR